MFSRWTYFQNSFLVEVSLCCTVSVNSFVQIFTAHVPKNKMVSQLKQTCELGMGNNDCSHMVMVQFMSDKSGLKTRSLELNTLGTA